jgi:hypothetical protein
MKDKMGEGLQLKSQDEIIDKNHIFRSRVRRRYTTQMQANCASSSDDEQFFKANDNMSMSSRSKVDYVMNVNNLNSQINII